MAFMTLAAGRVELAPFAGLFVGGAVMLLGLHAVANATDGFSGADLRARLR